MKPINQNNMTPKEKAEELFKKYTIATWIKMDEIKYLTTIPTAKECALIAVDEIINSEPRYPSNVDWDDCGSTHQYYYEAQMEEALSYWKEVKQIIENL